MADEAKMADHTYKFNVSMSCGGCSGAVNRVLGKLDGMPLPLPLLFPPPLWPLSPLPLLCPGPRLERSEAPKSPRSVLHLDFQCKNEMNRADEVQRRQILRGLP